jgi:hypothetical protein
VGDWFQVFQESIIRKSGHIKWGNPFFNELITQFFRVSLYGQLAKRILMSDRRASYMEFDFL